MGGRGPAPKHESVRARRNPPVANTVKLPQSGRKAPAPEWPLPADRQLRGLVEEAEAAVAYIERDEQLAETDEKRHALHLQWRRAVARLEVAREDLRISEAEELDLWTKAWATPQALQWELLGYDREVAQYVRWKVRAELGEITASREARMLADRLGLTPASMLHLRWEIADDSKADPEPEIEAAKQRGRGVVVDMRKHLKA